MDSNVGAAQLSDSVSFLMTGKTHRDYIQVMLRCVTQMMMPRMRRFYTTNTEQGFRLGYFPCANSSAKCRASYSTERMSLSVALAYFVADSLTVIRFSICLISGAFTVFTAVGVSIWATTIFAKLRQGLFFLTVRALFCYDCFRHDFFLNKKLRLEPTQAQSYVGLSYCS